MKGDLGGLWQELRDQAFEFPTGSIKMQIKSFRSFLQHHRVFLPSERITVKSEGDVKELTLDQIREIINHCPEPYKTIYTIFTYAPMGEVSFIKWNTRPDITKDVSEQLTTKKPYVKAIHPPRKNAKRKFYSLIPRNLIENYLRKGGRLPFTNTRGNMVQDYNLQAEWRRARSRAGLTDMKGVGCHEIRDAWFTYAGTQGVEWDVRKFTIGHSQFSEQGYNKLWENEDHVHEQLRKAWEGNGRTSKLEREIERLQQERVNTDAKRDEQLTKIERLATQQNEVVDGILGKLPKIERQLTARDQEIAELRKKLSYFEAGKPTKQKAKNRQKK